MSIATPAETRSNNHAKLKIEASAQPYYQGTGDGKYARDDVKKAIVRTLVMYETVYGENVSAYSQWGSVIYWPLRNRVYDICVTEEQIGSPRALREFFSKDFSAAVSTMQNKVTDDTLRLVVTSDTSAHWKLTSKGYKSFVISGREHQAYHDVMWRAFFHARLSRDNTGWDSWRAASAAGPGIYQSYILLRMRDEGLISFDGDVNHKTATIQGLKGMEVSVTEAGMDWVDENIGFEELSPNPGERWDLWYRDHNTYEFTNSILTLKAMEMAGVESFAFSDFLSAYGSMFVEITDPTALFETYKILSDRGYLSRIGPFETYGTNTYTYGDEIDVFIDWYDNK